MKGIWENNEVKELFSTVEDYKEKNKSLKLAFVKHAEKYGRKPNSVRNYYYHEVDNLKEDSSRLKRLGINLNLHSKANMNYFSPEEEKNLMKKIDEQVEKGISVRKACLTLSNGDVNQMLRYQNKYRNYISRNKKKEEQQKEPKTDNIITFKKANRSLSESEIQSLFMGLVRLVRRTALEESDAQYKNKLKSANHLLQKTLLELGSKEKELDRLKEEFKKLKSDNAVLSEINVKLKCDKANLLNKNNKK